MTPRPAPRPARHRAAVGVVLAAGAGRRFGRPKILVDGWLGAATRALADGGCDHLVVVTGAATPTAAERAGLPPGIREVHCADWERGLAASVATAARTVRGLPADTPVALHVVDCPGVDAAVVSRVLGAFRAGATAAEPASADPGAADRVPAHRAVNGGVPGHPVVLTAGSLRRLAPRLEGDRGLGPLLAREHPVVEVECGDLADGRDIDRSTDHDTEQHKDHDTAEEGELRVRSA